MTPEDQTSTTPMDIAPPQAEMSRTAPAAPPAESMGESVTEGVTAPIAARPTKALTSQETFIGEVVRTIIYALAIVFFVRTFLYQPFVIPSGSMRGTLLEGDYILVNKFAYGYSRFSIPFSPHLFDGRIMGSEPVRGDVVVFRPPGMPSTDYVKRIVGLPGDRIQMKDGVLHINGAPVGMAQIADLAIADGRGGNVTYNRFVETLPNGIAHEVLSDVTRSSADNTPEYTVPADQYFMMGDNRDGSRDSRFTEVGFIPFENIVGRVENIFFSADGSAAFWEIWQWPMAIRYDRMFTAVR